MVGGLFQITRFAIEAFRFRPNSLTTERLKISHSSTGQSALQETGASETAATPRY